MKQSWGKWAWAWAWAVHSYLYQGNQKNSPC